MTSAFHRQLSLAERLLADGAEVRAYDPQAMEKVAARNSSLRLTKDEYEAANGAEAVIVATEWPQFKQLDWGTIFNSMARPLIIDTRNLLNPQQMIDLGFEYYSVGRSMDRRLAAASSGH